MTGFVDDNFFRRADFWKGALRLGRQRPWLGHGLGSFEAAAEKLDLPTPLTERLPIARYRLRLEHAHNEGLESAVEIGWPATLLMVLAALAWALSRLRAPRVQDPALLGLPAERVSFRTIGPKGGEEGDSLLAAVAKAGADGLVMGAYRRGRVMEWILGGVTRHVLHNATVPLLMVH